MSDHLSLLCELDPEHFDATRHSEWPPIYKWRPDIEGCWLHIRQGITWEIAGWMLTQMQERSSGGMYENADEYLYLHDCLNDNCAGEVTPDSITDWYIGWKKIRKPVDAPAATLGTVTDQSPQQPKETGQAPANTYETDH